MSLLRNTNWNKCVLLCVLFFNFRDKNLSPVPFGMVERTGSLSLERSGFKSWLHPLKTMPGANFITSLGLDFFISVRRVINPTSKGYLGT